jgi:hypothetical protein
MSLPVSSLFNNYISSSGGLGVLKNEPYSQLFGAFANVTTSKAEYNIFNKTFDKDSPINNVLQSGQRDFTAQFTSCENIKVKNNGAKLYVSQSSPSDFIAEYNLTTPYDITTASYVGQVNLFATTGDIRGFDISADGTKMIVLGTAAANTLYEYTLSTPWSITSATYQSRSFSLNTQDTSMQDICLSVSGLRVIALGITNNRLYQYTLGSVFNLTSVTFNTDISMSSYLTTPTSSNIRGFARSDNGLRLVVAYTPTGGGNDYLQEIKLSADGILSAATVGLIDRLGIANLLCIDVAGNYLYAAGGSVSLSIIYSYIKSLKTGVLVDSVTFGFAASGSDRRMWFYGFSNAINGVISRPLDDSIGFLLKQMYSTGNFELSPVTVPLGIYASSKLSINAILQSFDAAYTNLKYCVNYRMV